MTQQRARAIATIGSIVFAAGLVMWHATPTHVVTGPVTVIFIGITVCAIGWLMGRSRKAAAVQRRAPEHTRSSGGHA